MASHPGPSLGWSIGLLFRAWQDGATAALDGLPHGARGFQILVTVAHDGPPTQAALAAHLGIDRTVLTYVLDDLVEAGLLERQIDTADRRVRRLALTGVGRTLIAQLEMRVAEAEDALLAALTPEEQQTLRTSLRRAAIAIHRGEPGHDECSAVVEILGDVKQVV
jgi:MarR family transcriptional regulator, transcriptional regulator for hemolysin